MCREAGIPDGTDVLAFIDLKRRTITITAASRLRDAIAAALDGLRRPATTPAAHATEPVDAGRVLGTAQANEQLTDRTAAAVDASEVTVSRRLRIVS